MAAVSVDEKLLLVQVRTVQIAAHDMVADDADLAVRHQQLAIRLGVADRQRIVLRQHHVRDLDPGRGDSGLGRTIGIQDGRIRETLAQLLARAAGKGSPQNRNVRKVGSVAGEKSRLASC